MTVKELKEELRILDPDPDHPVAVDSKTDVELSIVHDRNGDYLNLGAKEANEYD